MESRVKDGPQPVVVGLRDGVVAMVVALGAGDGHAHQRGTQHSDLLSDDLVLRQLRIVHGVARAIGSHAQEGGGNELVGALRIEHRLLVIAMRRACQFIAGNLLLDELVPWLVVVHRANDVVAIAPGIRPHAVGFREAIRVCVTHHIQPMPCPAFAIVFRGQ